MFHSRTAVGIVLLALTAALGPVSAFAQSQATTGVIEGTVSDAQGGRLPGASVTLVNTGTNFTRQLVTDANGRFQGLLLPLGTYKLSSELTGFGTYVQDGIELVVGQTATIQVVLQVASVQQEVTVTADSPIVQTSRADASTLINQQSIAGLPNNGRNVLGFMQLTPGVTIVQGADGDEISVNGQKGTTNNISVDGADFNNPFFGEQRGGQRPAFTFNQDSVKEMVVVADGAAPEFGRSGSGFVQIVTKSGTNDTRGRPTSSSSTTRCPRRRRTARSSRSTRSSTARRLAVRSSVTGCSTSSRTTNSNSTSASSSTRIASSSASSTSWRNTAAPARTSRSIGPTTRACSSARWTTS